MRRDATSARMLGQEVDTLPLAGYNVKAVRSPVWMGTQMEGKRTSSCWACPAPSLGKTNLHHAIGIAIRQAATVIQNGVWGPERSHS